MKPIAGKRILVCGKGGSGKSTIVALITDVLQKKEYEILVFDGDASNPEGLIRLMFGGGVNNKPKPLPEFFGGLNVATCPGDPLRILYKKRRISLFQAGRGGLTVRGVTDPSRRWFRESGYRAFRTKDPRHHGCDTGCSGPYARVCLHR